LGHGRVLKGFPAARLFAECGLTADSSYSIVERASRVWVSVEVPISRRFCIAFAGGENWSDRQTLDRFGEEQRRRSRPCTSPDVM
jgi:hypothetical protein